jgi:hypothetical protein
MLRKWTYYLIVFVWATGCYKSQSIENDTSQNKGEDAQQEQDLSRPWAVDTQLGYRGPCMRQTQTQEDGVATNETSYFFYDELDRVVAEYKISYRNESISMTTILLFSKPITPMMGEESWNTCLSGIQFLPIGLSIDVSDPIPESQTNCQISNQFSGMEVACEIRNNQDNSVNWNETVSYDIQENKLTWQIGKNGSGLLELAAQKIFYFNDHANIVKIEHIGDSEELSPTTTDTFSHEIQNEKYTLNIDISSDQKIDRSEKFTYDDRGNILSRKSTVELSQAELICSYDIEGNLLTSQFSDNDSPTEEKSYNYSPKSELISLTFDEANSPEIEKIFYSSEDGRITEMRAVRRNGIFTYKLCYEYDESGKIESANLYDLESDNSPIIQRMTNEYDSVGRPTKTEYSDYTTGGSKRVSYTYDCE